MRDNKYGTDKRGATPWYPVAHSGSPDLVEEKQQPGGVANNPGDAVNNPAHYQGKIEAIDAIESAVSGLSGFEGYCTGNSVKYLYRWKRKGGLQDLKKSQWYLQRLISKLECDQ